jgi:hypothetical protein
MVVMMVVVVAAQWRGRAAWCGCVVCEDACTVTHLRPVESGSEHEFHLTAVRWLDLTGHSHLRGPLERAHVHVLVLV